ncbi:alpha/beta hydrolase [Rhodococcus sp. HM1]|uniref:alpha/beta fold hydrolase n=1 Tax=unclassified Rhodococcus (in: high G+C Gram-positive bacteria) TaxID=192944 RepID=UPI0018CEFB80|nr:MULTISPECIES: alpha/beta hydrolase [unclassified Rhodococcus (in: high G+C Gram-positive bacteria)]MBH0119690.1 alpha/beta hydrolase [Rhodococcus sp. CX]MCK8672510.1 alpha/beta hydrolase [Rhodococcus sp. HM1]
MRITRFARAAVQVLAVVALALVAVAVPAAAAPRPTIVLVHGAFADTTSWDAVAADLRGRGYTVVVPDNPLRGPAHDAAAIEKTLAEISGPVVLVGHSYGGAVITNTHSPNVTALVYIAAFAPAQGEPVQLLLDPIRFPGSQLLPPALQVKVVDDDQAVGGRNLDGYIADDAFHRVFAPDVGDATAATMLAHQKSIALWANVEPSGPTSWSSTPSWYLVSAGDTVIPPASQRYMAGRIGAHTSEIQASHVALVSRPAVVADTIAAAADSAS